MPSKNIPRPPHPVPLIGDVRGMSRTAPMQATKEWHSQLGPIYQRRILGMHLVFAGGADIVEEINDETRWEKHLGRPLVALRQMAGDGLFTAHNDEPNWAKAHNVLMPAFTQESMRSYHRTMLAVAREMLGAWDQSQDALQVSGEMSKLTLETIGRTGFGYRFDGFSAAEVDPFVTTMLRVLDYTADASFPIPGLSAVIGRKAAAQNKADVAYLDSVVQQAIDRRREGGNAGDVDLLDRMLTAVDEDSGQRLDEDNIIRQVLTFLIAGHETTSGALSFALHYLMQNPAVFAAARAEVDAMWPGETDPDVQFEQIPKLRYIRRILDESLRLWPTAPAYFRQARVDTTVAGKYEFTKGDWVLVAIPSLHRDPTAWGDDAETFDPDRFLPANVRARPAHAYKPFGTGPRACIGRQFAIHEMVMALALIVHRYDLEPESGYEMKVVEQLSMRPDALTMKVRRRAQ